MQPVLEDFKERIVWGLGGRVQPLLVLCFGLFEAEALACGRIVNELNIKFIINNKEKIHKNILRKVRRLCMIDSRFVLYVL